MNDKAEFAVEILREYAKQNQTPVRSTSDLSPLEQWLILRLADTLDQGEQLCDHPRSERSYIGQNMLRCNKCGKEFS